MPEKTQEQDKTFIGMIGKIIIPEKEDSRDSKKQAEPADDGSEYIPELKKGGLGKVKEVVVKSALDSRQIPEQKIAPQPATEKDQPKQAPEEKEQEENIKSFKHTLRLLDGKEDTEEPLPKSRGVSIVNLILIDNADYQKALLFLCKKLSNEYGKVLLVTLNESTDELATKFLNERIDFRKFFFIDAVSLSGAKQQGRKTKTENSIYVSSPNALVELSLALAQALKDESINAVLFDSVSTLLIYEKDNTISKFTHSMIGKIRPSGINAYFTALGEDSQKQAVKDLSLFVDKVLDFREFVAAEYENFGIAVPGQVQPHRKEAFVNEVEMLRRSVEDAQGSGNVRGSLDDMREKLYRLEDMREKIVKLENLGEGEKEKFMQMNSSLEEIKEKLRKLDSLTLLEDKIRDIYRKIDEHDEKSQLSSELKKSIESQKSSELRDQIDDIKSRLKGMEGLNSLQGEIRDISKRISDTEIQIQKSVEISKTIGNESARDLSGQVDMLAKKIEDSHKNEKLELQVETFAKEIEGIEKKLDDAKARSEEMGKTELAENSKLAIAINEINTKLSKIENLGAMEQKLKELESIIERHDEKEQLGLDLKKSIEMQKTGELREQMDDIKARVKDSRQYSEETLNHLSKQLDDMRDRIEHAGSGRPDPEIAGKISNMENMLSRLENKLSAIEIASHLGFAGAASREISAEKAEIENAVNISESGNDLRAELGKLQAAQEEMERKRQALARKLESLKTEKYQSSKNTS